MTFIKKLENFKVELSLTLYFIIYYLTHNCPIEWVDKPLFEDGVPPCYLIDYSTGFGRRKLMGELSSLLMGDFITRKELFIFVSIGALILFVLFSFLIGKLYKRVISTYNKETYYGFLYILFLYLCCPFAITYLFHWENLGRMEMWFFILLCIYIYLYFKSNEKLRPLWAFVCIMICILIHPIFFSTYFPFYCLMIVYDTFLEGKLQKEKFIQYCIYLSIAILLLSILMFFPSEQMPLEECVEYLKGKTNMPINDIYINWLFYSSISEHLRIFVIPWLPVTITGLVVALIVFSPFFAIVIKYLKNSIRPHMKNTLQIWCYALAVSPMLIAYFPTIDFGRWVAADVNCVFLFWGGLLFNGHKTVVIQFENLYQNIKGNVYPYIFLLLYLSCFDKVGFRFQPIITDIVEVIADFELLFIHKCEWLFIQYFS